MGGTNPGKAAAFTLAWALALARGPAVSAQLAVTPSRRAPEAAVALSAMGTAIPFLAARAIMGPARTDEPALWLAASGVVLGPAAGHVYAGDPGRGLKGAAGRAIVLGATMGAAMLVAGGNGSGDSEWVAIDEDDLVGVLLASTGLLVAGVSAVNDIRHAGDRLRVRTEPAAVVSLRPAYFPGSGAAGLAVTVRH
jgi:hypothetical protein